MWDRDAFLDRCLNNEAIAERIVQKFRGQNIAGHVTLTKGERSPLAELASNLL